MPADNPIEQGTEPEHARVPTPAHAIDLSRLKCDALGHEQPQDRPRLLHLRPQQPAPIIELAIQITLELAPVESDIADAVQTRELIGERRPPILQRAELRVERRESLPLFDKRDNVPDLALDL